MNTSNPTCRVSDAGRAKARRVKARSKDPAALAAKLNLAPEAEQQVLHRLREMPETCRNRYVKAMRGRSVASAVKAFCLECMGWSRREVKACTAQACPLYPYRPFQRDPASGRSGPKSSA